jgi:hypothetical protein
MRVNDASRNHGAKHLNYAASVAFLLYHWASCQDHLNFNGSNNLVIIMKAKISIFRHSVIREGSRTDF